MLFHLGLFKDNSCNFIVLKEFKQIHVYPCNIQLVEIDMGF